MDNTVIINNITIDIDSLAKPSFSSHTWCNTFNSVWDITYTSGTNTLLFQSQQRISDSLCRACAYRLNSLLGGRCGKVQYKKR